MYLRRRLEGHENHVASIASTHDVSEGSSRIISGAEGGEMCLWSSHDGHLVKKLKIPNEENTFMALECSKANTDIFYASLGTRILAYDLRTFDKPFHEINAAEDEINNIVINDKEKLLSIADDTGTIKIYDFHTKSIYRRLRKHTNIVSSAIFRPGRSHELVSGGYDHKLLQWDFVKAKCFCNIDVTHLTGVDTPSDTITLNPPQIHSLSLSDDGKTLACGVENGVVLLMDATRRTLAWMANLRGHSKGVSQVHFARHSNQLLASAGNDSKLCLWSINLEASSDYGHTNGHTSSSINRSHRSNSTNHALQCEPIFSTCCQENFNWLASGSAGNVNFLLVAGNSIFPSVYNFT